jgi:hypothetical protein
MTEQEKLDCKHEHMKQPAFDPKEAAGLHSWHDVRMHFPRYQGECPACGKFLTVYASVEHRKAGNW